ncbi:MAG TPA: SGNH/GDSL hydrolase family protein [Gemmatimonadaceae bacterium]|nr:SGNH/GDSL hydrolase family protein [Gemmatimonadaceae bacterium]
MYRATAALVLGVAIAIAFLELAAAAALIGVGEPQSSSQSLNVASRLGDSAVTGASSPYFATVAWGETHWRELEHIRARTRYEPHVMWRRVPVRGETITVDETGIRRTPRAECGAPAVRVFVYGGSTTWGYGVPDDATIPALLQRELSARASRPVCVVNYGELGYTSTQSLLQLALRLRDGDVPHIAIFYDGVNDVTTADLYNEAGLHGDMNAIGRRLEAQRPRWWESFAVARLARQLFGVGEVIPRDRYQHTLGASPPRLAEQTAGAYLANHEMARALARDAGVEFFAFWQPNVLVEAKPLTREEALMREAGRPGRRVSAELVTDVYARVRAAAGSTERLYYIADIFAGEPRLLYMDWQHLVPEGNELVARRMARVIEDSGALDSAAIR